MQQSKNTSLPVGAAIARLVKLEYLARATGNRSERSTRELSSLVEALNAFEINLSFECGPESKEVEAIISEAESALDVLICDAETKCCRISEAETSTSSRERRTTSSRGE